MGVLSAQLAAIVGADAWSSAQHERLEAVLEQAHDRGSDAFPELRLSADAYVAHVASLVDPRIDADAMAALHHCDLYLALGCSVGHPVAIMTVESIYLADAATAVAAILKRDDLIADAMQQLRARVLTHTPDRAAAIATYAGRGPLAAWLKRSGRNLALNIVRKPNRETPDTDSLELGQDNNPELELLKARYRPQLRNAMAYAFARLAPDQRQLLRAYVVEGQKLETLAERHSVALSTVSRWLGRARQKLATDARRYFAEECGLPADECESLIRVVHSTMHVSVARMLGESAS